MAGFLKAIDLAEPVRTNTGGVFIMETRSRLLAIIKERSLSFGTFVLSSGRESSYYLDCRTTTLHPEGLSCIAELFLREIEACDKPVHAIGGPMIGADPLVAGVVALSHLRGSPIEGFIVRREPKKHGLMKDIEGNLKPGSSVAIVDDVVTTGGSVLRAIGEVEKEGCSVALVLSVVDRGEGAREAFRGKYDYRPIFDVGEILPDSPCDASQGGARPRPKEGTSPRG